ncbi:hypothetical protein MNBD_GAMMA21-2901 [hydrothermal vent metagenome]|uniref:Uncharacterized protein n=1 Tax=hydrothermal vent metagenome TaxID=652676 RepID=A0A3B1A8B8_9ZZZZ
MVKVLRLSAAGVIFFKLSGVAIAVELIEPAEGVYRTSQDPVLIRLQSLPSDLWPYLQLELGNIDVSKFVSRTDDVLRYEPQDLLAKGSHQLRLLAVTPDGNIDEVAVWQIEIRTSAGFIESSIEASVDLQVSQRVADNFESDTVGETQGQGSAVFASVNSTRNVRITSSADFIYNSQSEQTLTGREFDLNEFNLKSEWSQASVTVGHQTIAANSLVLTDFNRRGVSGSIRNEGDTFTSTAFGMRTETIAGFEEGLGIGDSQNRTAGAVINVSPISAAPEKLIVSALYLDGRGRSDGLAEEADETPNTGGSATALIVESYSYKKQAYLRGEYARTSFDFDGKNTGYAEQDDRASSIYVQFATERDQDRVQPNNWNVGLLRQRVGPWFYSLGNNYLPSDKESTQLITNYMSPSWQLNAFAAFERNNVTNDQNVPTIETRLITTALTYTPQSDTETPVTGMFSNPTYTFGYTFNEQEQVTDPTGFAGDVTDLKNSEASVSAGFAGDSWSWRVAYIMSSEDDVTNVYSDLKNQITSIEGFFPVGSQFTLTPIIQYTRIRDVDLNLTTTGWNSGLTIGYDNQGDWSASLTYTVTQEDRDDGLIDTRTEMLDIFAQWVISPAEINKPGFSLFTSANYQDTDVMNINIDQYQVFVGINASWPVTF